MVNHNPPPTPTDCDNLHSSAPTIHNVLSTNKAIPILYFLLDRLTAMFLSIFQYSFTLLNTIAIQKIYIALYSYETLHLSNPLSILSPYLKPLYVFSLHLLLPLCFLLLHCFSFWAIFL